MARKPTNADIARAIDAKAYRASHTRAYPGGPVITPLEASALGDDQPWQNYELRRRALLDQWDAWAASGGEATGGFWRDLLGGFFK